MSIDNTYDRITFSLPHTMNVALEDLKEELQRSKSDIIKQAITYFVQKQEEGRLEKAVKLMAKEYEGDHELTYLSTLDSEDFQ
jgi:metal-responsive CopG/Arc/MetJ family transcriptional regulator